MSSTAAKLIQNAIAESNNCDIPPSSTPPQAGGGNAAADGNLTAATGGAGGTSQAELGRPLTAEEKKQSNRDRNREHARCTRLRKKAYVNKLKELVDGLHAERSEDARKRRVAVQHLAEIQELRRKVVHTFLGYHSKFCEDRAKWNTILEGSEFWMKQPVTPYRSFRRCEIQKGSRILKGVDAMIRDSASMSVMIETIGSRNLRWLQRKRDDFLTRDASKNGTSAAHRTHRTSRVGSSGTSAGGTMPHSIVRQNSRLQHAVSSLSSSSGSSTGNGSGGEEERRMAQRRKVQGKSNCDQHHGHHTTSEEKKQAAKKVSSSSSSNDTQQILHNQASNDFHDYHAPSLPDPLPESGGSSPSSDSRQGDGMDSDNCVVGGGKHMCTDSSSGEDEKQPEPPAKKRKCDGVPSHQESSAALEETMAQASRSTGPASFQSDAATAASRPSSLPPNIARSGGILHNVKVVAQPTPMHTAGAAAAAAAASGTTASLPNGHANLSRAPATTLPPFVGIGKRKHPPTQLTRTSSSTSKPLLVSVPNPPLPPVAHKPSNNRSNVQQEESNNNSNSNNSNNLSSSHGTSHHRGNIITIDNESTSSQSSSQNQRGIQAHYHINEDDMILTDDVLMCPFIFRSQEAVWCGALAECVQPGMLRACFSPTNKLRNVEMIFDAMGFCQQLERASGNEGMAQIIPNSLEMALAPNSEEARVITLAKPPFRIVSVNEAWTAATGYTQLDAEGKELDKLLYGERTDREAGLSSRHMPPHDFENVARGVCAASTNVHYDINGREFLNFMCSYPLSNLSDEVTHILHVCQELPARG